MPDAEPIEQGGCPYGFCQVFGGFPTFAECGRTASGFGLAAAGKPWVCGFVGVTGVPRLPVGLRGRVGV